MTGSGEIRIRHAEARDHAVIVTFNRCLARESEGLELDAEIISAGVTKALASPALCQYFVAETPAGEVIGQTMVTYEMSDWRNGLIYWIQSVYVHQDWRGRGVYRRLYNYVQKTARAAGDGRAVRLYVDKTNTTAQTVYERLGMKHSHYHLFEADL